MPIIKVTDISHVRFSAPDLDQMRSFLTDFGLGHETSTDGTLYAYGAGIAPFSHSTIKGDAGFIGLGFRAGSIKDLELLARHEGIPVSNLDAPGGGKVLRLHDPDGRMVEIVAGQTMREAVSLGPQPPHNSASDYRRLRQSIRLAPGPARIIRLGHCVLNVSDFRKVEAWYKERFGFITSDEIEMAPGMAIGAFMRCDRGDQPCDHHSLFLLQVPTGPGFNHAAFEVADMDDLMRGHTHLKHTKRQATWGIGRHILGSQIFDYWNDPWGHELEHWTDGDLFTAADPSGKASFHDLLNVQWGPAHPLMASLGGAQ
jgi:catechol 2,3-dioxygenase-like lactoylglutathione lyase family enzyme